MNRNVKKIRNPKQNWVNISEANCSQKDKFQFRGEFYVISRI